MSKVPIVSVIMPVHNTEKYLKKSVGSVFGQGLKNIELICIDDCSSDGSLKALEGFRDKDSRIKILRNRKNIGAGLSRNVGIKKAQGEYICFLDSDDWFESGSLEELYEKGKSDDLDIVCVWPKLVFADRVVLDKRLLDFDSREVDDKDIVFRKTLMRKVAWAPWSKMVRRNLLIKNKILFPDIRIAEDMDFSAKVIYHAKRIGSVGEYFYNYNLREGSLMSCAKPKRKIENYFESIRLMDKFLREKDILKKFRREFIYFKLYNYLAIYGAMFYADEKLDEDLYKKNIWNDEDFRIWRIISLGFFDSVVAGSILIKIGLFGPAFRVREFFRVLFGKWGKRSS